MSILPAPGSHAGTGGIVLSVAVVVLFLAVFFNDAKDAGLASLVPCLLAVLFAIAFIAVVIHTRQDLVWFPSD
jgi:formate/nitrite transporter FocA (FNT family)